MQTVDFNHFRLAAGDRVLDLGCGEGRHIIAIRFEGTGDGMTDGAVDQAVDAVGVDLRHGDLLKARDRLREFAALTGQTESAQTSPVQTNPVQTNPAQTNPTQSGSTPTGSVQIDSSQTESNRTNPTPTLGSSILSSASALALPFADGSFDKVICSEVLEHIPNYPKALAEINRVLKPGGLFCASVPRRWPERLCWALSEGYHNVPGGHVHIFKRRALRREIESLGMRQYHHHGAHALHAPFWWLKCLFWNNQNNNWLIRQYHRLLVWDLMARPALTRILERLLNPVLGKSVVMYFEKGAA